MTRLVQLSVLLGGIALGIVAYRIQLHDLDTTGAHAAAIVVSAWAFVVAGLLAWSRRPESRLGPLIAAAGLALLLRQLRYSHDALLFTVFFIVGELSYWLVAHAVFAYPSGRVIARAERIVLGVGYGLTFLFSLAVLLLYDGSERLRFFDRAPHRSLIVVARHGHAAVLIQRAFVVVVWGALAAIAIGLIVRKLARATPRLRHILAPLLLAAIAVALLAVLQSVTRPGPHASGYLFWWQIAAFIALPLALLAGLLRARLARATVGDLVLELEHTPPQGLRDALARAFDDPTLEVAFWLPERRGYADAAGLPVDLPAGGAGRAVTHLDHEGEPLAALVHDPSLLDEPKLVQAAGAAARMSLENARLQADMRAQLAKVQESRVRIVAAADEERRRIERDIHDGAQQRLVALGLQLRTAQRRLGEQADPDVDRLIAETVDQLQGAVDELRELARGVHPAILTEDGLAAALESLASRTPFPVSLVVSEERLPPQVEATAYFLACEALANVVKHANASRATIRAGRRDGLLVVEVSDDGIGGVDTDAGSGLRGLTDRVEALGGRLRIESPAGGGTRIEGEIPCGVEAVPTG